MGTVSRGTKAYGGTEYQSGRTLLASELDGDLNPIVSEINGNLDDSNVKAGGGIDPEKIDDYSVSDTEYLSTTTPGESYAPSKPTTLAAELARIRYSILRSGAGFTASTSPVRHGSTGATLGGWIDAPARGKNLLIDGSFESWSSGTALISWSNVGSPTLARTTTLATEGAGKCVRITSAAASEEGITQTIAGLKTSQKYLVSARARLVSGDATAAARLEVTGADATSEYRPIIDTDCQTTSATFVTLCAVVKTDSTPTALTVRCITNAINPCVAEFDHVSVFEMQESIIEMPREVIVSSVNTTATAGHYVTAAWTDAGPSLSLTPPGPGYQIVVQCQACVSHPGPDTAEAIAMRLLENGSQVTCTYITQVSGYVATLHPFYMNMSPTPGTTYTYVMEGKPSAAVGNWGRNSNLGIGDTPSTHILARMFACG